MHTAEPDGRTKKDQVLDLWAQGMEAVTIARIMGWAGRGSVTRAVFDARERGDERALRQLSGHIVNPATDKIKIEVVDDPGHGGASHYYLITGVDYYANAALKAAHDLVPPPGSIIFQNGPIGEHSPNGVTQEALLEIVADRLRSFQAGPYACRENALALTKIEEAQHWLQQRTLARMRRGVEGKSVV